MSKRTLWASMAILGSLLLLLLAGAGLGQAAPPLLPASRPAPKGTPLPTDHPGRALRAELPWLLNQDVPMADQHPAKPVANSAPPSSLRLERPRSMILPAPRSLEPASVIMSQNFEGVWPAPGWNVVDQSADDGGEFFWGKRNCHPHTGSYAGWSVGGGANGSSLACSAEHPDYIESWAVYGPFNLSSATSASLTFHLWGQAEWNGQDCYDFLYVARSVDGQQFSGTVYCGDWTGGTAGNGYYQRTLDLTDQLGVSQVWVAFLFSTDFSVSWDGGMTVDDITLDVTGTAPTSTPTNTPTRTPTNTPTRTPTNTPTRTPTNTPTRTPTPTVTGTPEILPFAVHLPAVARAEPLCPNDPYEPNGTFEEAWGPLLLNEDLLGYFNCPAETDRDYYYANISSARRVVITLQGIPAGSDYDLTLYSCASAGCLVAHSGNPGNADEEIDRVLPSAGRYYVRVTRSPSSPLVSQAYRLRVATP